MQFFLAYRKIILSVSYRKTYSNLIPRFKFIRRGNFTTCVQTVRALNFFEFILRALGNYGSECMDDGMKKVGGNGTTLRKPSHTVCVHFKAWYEQGSNRGPHATQVSALIVSHRGPSWLQHYAFQFSDNSLHLLHSLTLNWIY